ncbi:ABC transporter ATP-binding protein [Pararhodobacter sp. SW119]|uniref:ABC transporter ATP-binding protein n=1 Tax=Pararhodobacter sp. SW119 TaxID=2780075 RepID=UPI001ADFCD5B|nr:ABC transporter ATP-binding protein [Pararhodobacter sp. SW119]
MIRFYRMVWEVLDRTERRRFLMLMALAVLAGLLEMVGIAAILPFLQVVSDPEIISRNVYLDWLNTTLAFESTRSFSIFLGVAVLILVLISLTVRALTMYATTRFGVMRAFSISSRLLERYLHQPYIWFLSRHSADIGKTVLTEVGRTVSNCILPALQLVASAITVIFIGALLFAVEPAIALGTALVLGGAYGVIYMGLRRMLRRIGLARLAANQRQFHSVQEATGGLKELKIMGLEHTFMSRFRPAAYDVARHQARANILGQMPRFVLEGIAISGLVLILLWLMIRDGGNIGQMLPTMGVLAMAALRLLPALQQVFNQLATIRFNVPSLENIHTDLTGLSPDPGGGTQHAPTLNRALELQEVEFAYPDTEMSALRGLSLFIPARTTVGIVGGTGAGKTTAVDIILGLLDPLSGTLMVDDVEITPANLRSWQSRLGYVPQHIFLSDGSVAANIAFGLPKEKIDMEAVERAARMASLHDFVMNELAQGYETHVGERGVRLSGGQRQRVGIARALYHDPDVLIFDEATSALDNLTERAVMEAVHKIGGQKTIIMIAHRLSTVRQCETIFLLDHGQLIAQGSYDDLVAGNETFRRMAANG